MKQFFRVLIALAMVAAVSARAQQNPPADSTEKAHDFRGGFDVGFNVVGNDFTKKYINYTLKPLVAAYLEFPVTSSFGIQGSVMGGQFGTGLVDESGNYFSYQAIFGGILASPYLHIPELTFWQLAPFLQVNAALLVKKTTKSKTFNRASDDWLVIPAVGFSIGVMRPISDKLSIRAIAASYFTNSDQLDGRISGVNHDAFTAFTIGLSWKIGGPRRMPTDLTGATTIEGRRVIERPKKRVAPPAGVPATTLNSSLAVSTFSSFAQLRENPDRIALQVRKTGPTIVDASITFRLMKDSTIVAQSTGTHAFDQQTETLDAGQLVDFHGLNVKPGYDSVFAPGRYTVSVALYREGDPGASTAFADFHLADVTPSFGSNAGGVERMIARGEAHITSSDSSGVLTLGTFAVPNPQSHAEPDRSASGADASDSARSAGRHPAADYAIMRNPMSAVPVDVPEQGREEYIRNKVAAAFKRAQQLLQMAREAGISRSIPDVIVSMVFFEYDQTALSDEARVTLDAVAQELAQSPSFVADIRGYADEVGDETYNLALSRIRAEKVAEYLTRNRVSSLRLSTLPLGKIDNLNVRPDRTQQFNRRVEIVLTGVKEN